MPDLNERARHVLRAIVRYADDAGRVIATYAGRGRYRVAGENVNRSTLHTLEDADLLTWDTSGPADVLTPTDLGRIEAGR